MELVRLNKMFVIRNKKIFFTTSALAILIAIGSIIVLGLNFGIEFKGGAIIQVSYENPPAVSDVESAISDLGLGNFSLQPAGEKGFILKTPDLSETEQNNVLEALTLGGTVEPVLDRVSSVGPSVGRELRTKALIALSLVVIAIILFITFAFRKVSLPVASWKYGLVAIVALVHDIIIPTGAFAILGHFLGYEVDVLFVTALLAILGYSVSDTIVVFDRIRENLRTNQEYRIHESFEDTVGKSLSQTYARSINTSLSTILALLALYIFGGVSTEHFALTLLIGVIAGTYSSIFLASPLLVVLGKGKE